jgi:hypothetical protein
MANINNFKSKNAMFTRNVGWKPTYRGSLTHALQLSYTFKNLNHNRLKTNANYKAAYNNFIQKWYTKQNKFNFLSSIERALTNKSKNDTVAIKKALSTVNQNLLKTNSKYKALYNRVKSLNKLNEPVNFNTLERWTNTNNHSLITAASRGKVRELTNNNAEISRIKKLTNTLGKAFKPKNSYSTKHLYRGIKVNAINNIYNITGYSSWTTKPHIAQSIFARGRGIVFRINTNKLKGIPVINVGGQEGEYILPPMKIIMNTNSYNNGILPVTNVVVNQRWAPSNRPSIIPRMAARRIKLSK